ncbi:hypothetical protein A2U01_0041316 [Trifolium medium]|uniref:Uncharacterized protein n=1 Tax=Trifolium medium TaxID=97028 RepID=A0A392QA70_9FABA|nr:hypothetical protein [Trifolium medium]
MRDGFMTLPSDISDEAEFLKTEKLQEDLAAQKAEQELLKEEVKNLTESQHHVIKT